MYMRSSKILVVVGSNLPNMYFDVRPMVFFLSSKFFLLSIDYNIEKLRYDYRHFINNLTGREHF